MLSPLPAVLVEEADRALREFDNVPPALARSADAVMNDPHRWHIRALRDAVQAHAPVEVLEIEEITRIEATGGVDRVPPHEHEATAHHRHRGDETFGAGERGGVAHLIAIEALPEQAAQCGGRKAAQRQIEHAGIALARRFALAVGAGRRRSQYSDFRMRVEKAQAGD